MAFVFHCKGLLRCLSSRGVECLLMLSIYSKLLGFLHWGLLLFVCFLDAVYPVCTLYLFQYCISTLLYAYLDSEKLVQMLKGDSFSVFGPVLDV